MTWQDLLNAQKVRPHKTSRQEVQDLRAVVSWDLADAGIAVLSDDRRFATAYNAVLQIAKIAIACAGYRVVGIGHHQSSFQALEVALGPTAVPFSAYFDQCRRQRNQVDYDLANVATRADVELLIQKSAEVQTLVEAWIKKRHPGLAV